MFGVELFLQCLNVSLDIGLNRVWHGYFFVADWQGQTIIKPTPAIVLPAPLGGSVGRSQRISVPAGGGCDVDDATLAGVSH